MTQPTQNLVGVLLQNYDGTFNSRYPTGNKPTGTIYRHGDPFTFSDASLGSATVAEKQFLGGDGGYIETLANGASAVNGSKWDFYYSGAGVAYTGYTDSIRGKVLRNDYGVALANPQIDAIISMSATSPIPEDTTVYVSFFIRAVAKDAGGVDVPDSGLEQWKMSRGLTTTKTIQDSANINNEIVNVQQFSLSGLITRVENSAGAKAGTITSATTTSLYDATGTMVPNVFASSLVTVTKTADGTKQYVKVLSNDDKNIVFASAITLPIAGDTYSVGGDGFQYSKGFPCTQFVDGWICVQASYYTGTQGQANGTAIYSIYQNGALINRSSIAGVPIYGSAARSQYIPMIQSYIKNGTSIVAFKETYADDVYVQIGSDKRLLLTDSTSIDSAEIYAIQPWGTWSSNTVDGFINTGGITTTGTYYICAVSGANTVLWSQQIFIEV